MEDAAGASFALIMNESSAAMGGSARHDAGSMRRASTAAGSRSKVEKVKLETGNGSLLG